MIKEKALNNPNLLGIGVSQYLRVSRRCPTWDRNSIFFLELNPIPFLGLDLIDPRSSNDCYPKLKFSLTVADPATLCVTPGGAGVSPEHVTVSVLHHEHRGALVQDPGHQLLRHREYK